MNNQSDTNKEYNLNLKIHLDKHEQLKEIARHNGTSVSGIVRMLIYSRLDEVSKTGDFKAFLHNL